MPNRIERLIVREYDELINAFVRYTSLIRLIRADRLIEKTAEPTIATISLFNMMHSPECYDNIAVNFESCRWHWDFYLFIKRELEGDHE